MKKMTLAVAFALTPAIVAFSQVSFGIKAGLNFANQAFKAYGQTTVLSSPAGVHGGVYLCARFGKFGVQPEAFFSMAGARNGAPGSSDRTYLDYVSMPVLFRYHVTRVIHVHVGPQLGNLMDARQTIAGTTSDIKNHFRSTDLGLAFGAGFNIDKVFIGGIRYVAGTSNIEKPNTTGIEIKNNIFQIYLEAKLLGK